MVIDQRNFPGQDEYGDGFGTTVGAADLDNDGFADIVVGAPGEDREGRDGITVPDSGAITVIRGGKSGHARDLHIGFAKTAGIRGTPVPGEQLGASVTVLDIAGNRRPEVIVKSAGAADIEHALIVLEPQGGPFAPSAVLDWRPLRRGLHVANIGISQIRMGRGPSA
jgi:hypothetical protein